MRGTASEITTRGRGRGLSHLRRIAKERIRPPDAYLKERDASPGRGMNVLSSKNDPHLSPSEGTGKDVEWKGVSERSDLQRLGANSPADLSQPTATIPQDEQVKDITPGSLQNDEKQKTESNAKGDKLEKEGHLTNDDATDILMQTKLNVNAPEFSFKGRSIETKEEDMYLNNQEHSADAITGEGEHDFVIGLFQEAVNTLTFSPGHYVAIIDNLLETLQMFISEAETMQSIVDIILQQAIESQNFVYTAVKLIKLFLEKLIIERQDCVVRFRSCFYPSLQNLYKELPDLFKDHANSASLSRAFGISLLFADLLCNLKTQNGELNNVFQKAVFLSIDLLIQDPTKEMVQTLIKLLKLTGPTLDEYHSMTNRVPKVDEIFAKLKELSVGDAWLSHLDNGKELRDRVFKIYKLRSRLWDLTPAKTLEEPSNASFVPTAYSGESFSDVDWTEYCGPEDFDDREEYDDDFELFLKETKQI